MRPGSGRRTRSRGAGPNAARALQPRRTRGPPRPTSSAPSARLEGKGAGLVLPRCTTEGMTLHLDEISQAVAPGAHALVLVDQAGWHQSKRLVVPDNITLVPLPSKAPELNPVENIWQFMRENWISNRIFTSYTAHPRPLLRSVEQAHRSALAHHVHRPARLGPPVLINGTWYITPSGGPQPSQPSGDSHLGRRSPGILCGSRRHYCFSGYSGPDRRSALEAFGHGGFPLRGSGQREGFG